LEQCNQLDPALRLIRQVRLEFEKGKNLINQGKNGFGVYCQNKSRLIIIRFFFVGGDMFIGSPTPSCERRKNYVLNPQRSSYYPGGRQHPDPSPRGPQEGIPANPHPLAPAERPGFCH